MNGRIVLVGAAALALLTSGDADAGKGLPGFATDRAAGARTACGPRRCVDRAPNATFRAKTQQVRSACYPEIASLCAADMGRPPRVWACLKRNAHQVSPTCRATLQN